MRRADWAAISVQVSLEGSYSSAVFTGFVYWPPEPPPTRRSVPSGSVTRFASSRARFNGAVLTHCGFGCDRSIVSTVFVACRLTPPATSTFWSPGRRIQLPSVRRNDIEAESVQVFVAGSKNDETVG